MKRDTIIHFREMLLTLNYLLNNTDERNPATQIDICSSATEFGLKYDKKNQKGNDVKRQRIGECLKYLMDVSSKYPDQVPFIMQQTDSGKYYIEEKNYLDEEKIIKVLAAVKNDKYIQEDETNELLDRLLSVLSNKNNIDFLKSELEKMNKGAKKHDAETNRRIRLVNKALNEGKMIKLIYRLPNEYTEVWYRVCLIKELQRKQYAFLLPVSDLPNATQVFKPIEYLPVVRGKDSEVLRDDQKKNRSLDELFAQVNPSEAKKYKTIIHYLESSIIPNAGGNSYVSFYFKLADLAVVKRSFEEYFYLPLTYQKVSDIDSVNKAIQDIDNKFLSSFVIVALDEKKKEPKYGLANICVNIRAFESWLLTNPRTDELITMSYFVTVLHPTTINKKLANYLANELINKKKYLNDYAKEAIIDALTINKKE